MMSERRKDPEEDILLTPPCFVESFPSCRGPRKFLESDRRLQDSANSPVQTSLVFRRAGKLIADKSSDPQGARHERLVHQVEVRRLSSAPAQHYQWEVFQYSSSTPLSVPLKRI